MGSGASIASSLAPTGVAAAVIVCPPAGLAAGMIFGAGMAVGAALGASDHKSPDAAAPVVFDALDAIYGAAEAAMEYLTAACSACEGALRKLEEAAALVVDRVAALLLRLRGRESAAAARREMRRAAARLRAGHDDDDAFSDATGRVVRSRRRITGAAAAYSSAALGSPESVRDSDVARHAATRAAEMMELVLEAFVAEARRGHSIPAVARSFITVIAAAAAICLDVVLLSPTAADAHD